MSLRSRLIQILGLGRSTTAVTDGGKIRTVQMKFPTTGETRGEVPFMQHYGFASRPHAGCDFTVVALDHHPGKSIAIASNDQRWTITLAEGEIAMHDDQDQKFHLTRDGWDILDKSGNRILSSPAGVAITSATLTHNGVNIGSTHEHTGVTSGASDTGPPVA
ncbi:MAG TPA: phage baseplate assembly protein [Rhodopila sp.]|nr:phage baseplate assembly protein [Rhodopila sp.]